MSFKGFTKAVQRAPQSFRQKLNMGQQTSDPVYEDAERRFKELESETKKLSDESKRYFNAVNGMLQHQIGFSKAMSEIFKPISGKMSDPNATVPEDNPEGIEASEQYCSIVAELQTTLKPDLTLIDEKIVKPAQELLKIIDRIRKMATKRNHKKLDLDRALNTFNKYDQKANPTPKDEEKKYKAEANVQVAQQEYDYYNDMLKNELPYLFQLEGEFVKPLFVSFYYMQLNIFYTLYNKFQDMKIPYFDLDTDILEAFQAKRGNIEEQTDSLTITNFKLGYSKAKLDMTRKRYGVNDSRPGSPGSPVGQPPAYGAGLGSPGAPGAPGAAGAAGYNYGAQQPAYGAQQPAYGAPAAGAAVGAGVGAGVGAAAAAGGYGYNSPSATATQASYTPPTSVGTETCTALYDYTAQTEGDLSFPAGAVIQVVDRSDAAGWWVGIYNGVQGVFPGNYVELSK